MRRRRLRRNGLEGSSNRRLEVPGKPGVYRAVAFLRPHFQLDELTVSLRLVGRPAAAAK